MCRKKLLYLQYVKLCMRVFRRTAEHGSSCGGAAVLFCIEGGFQHVDARVPDRDGVPAGAGRGHGVRLPRRHHPEHLRRIPAPRLQRKNPPLPHLPRAGRVPCRRRLRPVHGKGGGVLRHLRPRRHQPGHRHRHRLLRLLPGCVYHLQRQRKPHRQGLLPGGRHHRHHHAHYQV